MLVSSRTFLPAVRAAGLCLVALTLSCQRLVGIDEVALLPPETSSRITAQCADSTSKSFAVDGPAELIVIQHYEPATPRVAISISRSKPIVLALASYEPTIWAIATRAGARIDHIILLGEGGGSASTVEGAPGVPVDTGTAPVADHPSDEPTLAATAQQLGTRYAVPVGGYVGCYTGAGYLVDDL